MIQSNHKQFADQNVIAISADILGSLSFPIGESYSDYISLDDKAYRDTLGAIAGVVFTDIYGTIVHANKLFCKLSGYSLRDLIGKGNDLFNSGHHPREFYVNLWRTIKSNQIWRGEICNRAKNGTLFWVDTTIAPRRSDSGEICGYVALRLDITARKLAEALAIAENHKRLEMEALLNDIFETLPNGVIAYAEDGRILRFNKALEEIYKGLVPSIKLGRRRQDIIASVSKEAQLSPAGSTAEKFNPASCCLNHLQKLPNGHWLQIQNRKSPTGTLVSVQTDVTTLKRAEEHIAQQARTDSLTGIFNRHALFEQLSECCRLSNDPAQPCSLILIDLDHFKAINDGMGHDGGDALLRHIAECLQSAIRDTDMVARVGGDEFAILLADVHTGADIKSVMEKLRAALSIPTRIGQQTIIPSASMGVATFPRDGITPEELMKSADLALYRCKQDGRGTYRVYNLSMRRQRTRRALLTDKLHQALARDEFSVVFQPQRDILSGRHVGFEALVRWKVGRKWIPPQELISIAEEAGLITQLSYQLINKALAMMARLKSSGMEPGIIGINVVAAQLHEPNFVKKLMHLLHKHGIKPFEVEIEVTENVILDRSAENIARVLRKLHSTGMSIALDDFGMGYASLTHLKRFPLHRLKIDRSFISGVTEDKDDHSIVCAIISLAHSLGLEVVAEGVETPEQYREVSNLGCDSVQGYLIARPMDERASYNYLEQSNYAGPLSGRRQVKAIALDKSPGCNRAD